MVGATSLFTTVHDLAAWDRNFVTGRVGGREALERMHQRFVLNAGDTIGYAHGLSVGSYRGLRTVGHGGADAGYRSNFLRFPDQGLSVAVLCNFPSADPGGRAQRVAEAYLEDLMEPRTETAAAAPGATVTLAPAEAAAIAGVYRGELPYQISAVRLERDTLRLGLGDGPVLRPLGGGRLEVVGRGTVATFTPAAGGARATLEVPGMGPGTREDAWRPEPSELEAFEGRYVSDELGTEYRLVVEEDGLVARHRKLEPRTLVPTFRDAFLLRGASAVFTRDVSGAVEGFTVSQGRVWNVRFRRADGVS